VSDLIHRLRELLGDDGVLTEVADLAGYRGDLAWPEGGDMICVARPRTTVETSAVVRACAAANAPVVPRGGGTGLTGGATPPPGARSLVLSFERMRRIRAIDTVDDAMIVEAGCPLAEAQAAAERQGRLLGLDHGASGSSQIGGNLSTNAGGTAVLRFGNARDLTLGIEIVLADGRVWSGLRSLRKDNTGYDLKQLFIGAEGTLGVITAAVLKLFPASRTQATALVALASLPAAVALLGRLQSALSDRLTGFELISSVALALSRKLEPATPAPMPGHAWYVLVQTDDSAQGSPIAALLETSLAEAVVEGIVVDATIAQSEAQAARLWALRENISEAQQREGPNIKHDISLAVSSIPAFVDECNAALLSAFPRARLIIFGHLGDGNLHYNLSASEGEAQGDFLEHAAAVNRVVHDLVAQHGGSFSAEHGIGQLKRADLLYYKDDVELELMRTVKRALDPRGLLNPGKVL